MDVEKLDGGMPGLTEVLDALMELESACEARTAARTQEQYLMEVRLGQSDLLIRLDLARYRARELLRNLVPNA